MTLTPVAPSVAEPRAPGFPFAARGPLSAAVLGRLTGRSQPRTCVALAADLLETSPGLIRDDDAQAALFALYASSYGAFAALSAELEWDGDLIAARLVLEARFEAEVRAAVRTEPPATADVPRELTAVTTQDRGPSLPRFIAKKADAGQVREFLIHRSIYTLREADPHSWAIPRLTGAAKAALVEIQSDEYGGGQPDRMHAQLFASAMRAAGLDSAYGRYIDEVPALTLASHNLMSMFGLNRRLLGAVVGHLAAFEMTSSIPNGLYAAGMRRLGFGTQVTEYFDEHVEADAVHEQIAAHDLAGSLVAQHPEMLTDVMFGAAACLTVDGWMADHMLDRWAHGVSSLRAGSAHA